MKPETFTITFTTSGEMKRKVLSILSLLSFNSKVGHSGYWYVGCDGDGADYLAFEPKELYNPKDKYATGEIKSYIKISDISTNKSYPKTLKRL